MVFFEVKKKPYFNNQQGPYLGRQPPFYAADSVEGISALEKKWHIIYEELLSNLGDEEKRRVCFKKNTLKKIRGWEQIELKIYGVEYPQRVNLFPRIMEILEEIPSVSTIYFSILSPHSSIEPHVGDTDAYFRVHLGLQIPAGLPDCGIEVAGQQRDWKPGRCIAFNDVYCHAAWNKTDKERVVLIIDILRPEFKDHGLYVEAGVRATLYHSRLYGIFLPIVELLPRFLTRMSRPIFHFFSYVYHTIKYRLFTGHSVRGLK
jgi:ornithine lipid ester-linked acyl 2-hydroxylase